MKYPLGRIHPHGSGGKSVYQRAAQEANESSSGFLSPIFMVLGSLILGFAAICLVLAPECFTGVCVMAAIGKVLLDG